MMMQSQTIGTTVQINNNNYDDANPLNLEFYYFFFYFLKRKTRRLYFTKKCSIFNFILLNRLEPSDFEFWLVFRINPIGHLGLLVNEGKKFASY